MSTNVTKDRLDQAMLAAHEDGDYDQLVRLYTQAAQEASTAQAQSFYLTHAYVFALESDHPMCNALKARLVALGSEE